MRFFAIPILAMGVLLALPQVPGAAAATSTAWLVPYGITCPQTCKAYNIDPDKPGSKHIGFDTGVWRSEGYDPQTSWSSDAFGCPGATRNGQPVVWLGQDDDDTGLGVFLGSTLEVSGLRYRALGWSGYPHPYPHRNTIDLSMDGINWTHVADLSATLTPFKTWVTVQATWPPRAARYMREFVETDGSFTNELNAQLQVPSTTPHTC
jgi:hypothetical protein